MVDLDGWAHAYSGKVRDMYVPQDSTGYGSGNVMLLVASDRISAYDHILPTDIPDKGKILNQLSLWWFDQLADMVDNHVVSLDVPEKVKGRAVIVRRLQMVPIELVVRGYLTGTALAEYRQTGSVCGVSLPPGLRDGDKLAAPIFTPAAKAAVGEHDENITYEQMSWRVGEIAPVLRETAIAVYERAHEIAAARGLVLADTKLEMGVDTRDRLTPILADEVITPDSSRFWSAAKWVPGKAQDSFDKQYVRDWLSSPASGWRPSSDTPPPPLPDEVVERTRERYIDAFRALTGREPEL